MAAWSCFSHRGAVIPGFGRCVGADDAVAAERPFEEVDVPTVLV